MSPKRQAAATFCRMTICTVDSFLELGARTIQEPCDILDRIFLNLNMHNYKKQQKVKSYEYKRSIKNYRQFH